MIADRISQKLQTTFRNAHNICVLTGEDLAATNGVPPFYDKRLTYQQWRLETLLTAEFFQKDPLTLWQWLEYRRVLISGLTPGKAYQLLVDWEKLVKNFTLITQNVDGFHTRAGNSHVIELQGNLSRGRCSECLKLIELTERLTTLPPICKCGGKLRPGINYVNEYPATEMVKYVELTMMSSDLFFLIGVGASFTPAVTLLMQARQMGIPVLEITRQESTLTPLCDVTLMGSFETLLQQF